MEQLSLLNKDVFKADTVLHYLSYNILTMIYKGGGNKNGKEGPVLPLLR